METQYDSILIDYIAKWTDSQHALRIHSWSKLRYSHRVKDTGNYRRSCAGQRHTMIPAIKRQT